MISPARVIAHAVLSRVEEGGWGQELLLSESRGADSRDAGLAAELVYGCERRRAQLDWLIEKWSGRAAGKLDAAVRIALRIGIYQLRHLDRVPAHAVVNDSVELVKRARKKSASGFVNAVLRKVSRDAVEWPSRAIALSQPQWLLDLWDREFGQQTATTIADTFLLPAETYVRNPPLDRPGLELEETDVSGAWRVVAGDTEGLRIQDVGSQSIVPLLELQPGMSFLDLCSAPGNKTAQALEMGVRGIACDVHLHRLRTVTGCPRVVLNATQALPFRQRFDRILIDAPCSGTGTLARNPEIRWRIQASDLEELHLKQVRILQQGLQSLAVGGKLVYSTCSLEVIENERVIEEIRSREGMEITTERRRTPGVDPGYGFYVAVITSK